VFDRADAGTVGSNPTQGHGSVVFVLCVRFSVFVYR
jgi:hypothetical protein